MNGTKIGSGDKVLDWVAFIAALILFAKTADLLSYFSPAILSDILGFDVSLIYGSICAALVEGLALALHFNRRATLSSTAQVVKWILIAISGVCQVFDGFITTDSVAQMSDTMKAGLSYGVPLIPLLIMVMVFGIGQLPEVDVAQGSHKKPFIGLKGMWNHLINGGNGPAPAYQLPPQIDLELPPSASKSNNHKKDEVVNPTMGEER